MITRDPNITYVCSNLIVKNGKLRFGIIPSDKNKAIFNGTSISLKGALKFLKAVSDINEVYALSKAFLRAVQNSLAIIKDNDLLKVSNFTDDVISYIKLLGLR